MPIKVFLSYSHKDEEFKEELETHLALLKRNKIIEAWSDRKISPGEDWETKIDKELNSADIILLLISSDFINSDYCFNLEATGALSRHEREECIVVPIFVRSCSFEGAPFAKLQGLPRDAKPINSSPDRDAAWTAVARELERLAKELDYKKTISAAFSKDIKDKILPEHETWLNDTEIEFKHRRVDRVSLKDIYTPPDLKLLNDDIDELTQIRPSEKLTQHPENTIIYGDEQAGKTSLSKYLIRTFVAEGYFPVRASGHEIKSSDAAALIENLLKKQYTPEAHEAATQKGRIILIVDDFDAIKLSKKYTNEFCENAINNSQHCYLLAHESYQYVAIEHETLTDFTPYEILYFGNVKRSEMIERWVSIGIEQTIEETDLFREVDELKAKINAVVRGNVVPAKPIYILTVLQMLEAYSKQNIDLTSHGHCYQYLVYQALDNAKIRRTEHDKYINVLTELAWTIYKNKAPLNKIEITRFFKDYEKNFVLGTSPKHIIEKLTSHGLLKPNTDEISFKYPYIFYFFVGTKNSRKLLI